MKYGIIFAGFLLLAGCSTWQTADDTAASEWPGVSSGTVTAAPAFATRPGGGQWGERTPRDIMNTQGGYRAEDLSASTPPGTTSSEGRVFYERSSSSGGASSDASGSGAGSGLGSGSGGDSGGDGYAYASSDGSLSGALDPGSSSSTGGSSGLSSGNSGASGRASTAEGVYSESDPVEDWIAQEGSTLRSLMSDWSEKSGWRLVWNTDREYILQAGAMFRGRYVDVSSALIRSFARATPAPWGTFYKGNRVLLVTAVEDENAE